MIRGKFESIIARKTRNVTFDDLGRTSRARPKWSEDTVSDEKRTHSVVGGEKSDSQRNSSETAREGSSRGNLHC